MKCHKMNYSESTDDCAKSIEKCLSACDTDSIKCAGNVFLNNKFDLLEKFVALTNQKLGAEVSTVDFSNSVSAAEIVNDWVNEKTDGLINKIISPKMITESTLMTLVTAILFKGKWKENFEKSWKRVFRALSGKTEEFEVRADFMELRKGDLFGYYKDENRTQVIDIPYQDQGSTGKNRLVQDHDQKYLRANLVYDQNILRNPGPTLTRPSTIKKTWTNSAGPKIPDQDGLKMTIIMPEGNLYEFESDLSSGKLIHFFQNVSVSTTEIILAMPKFKFRIAYDLKKEHWNKKLRVELGCEADVVHEL